MKNKQMLFILGHTWMMLSLALPEDRAFDMLVAFIIAIAAFYCASKSKD